MYKQTVLRPTKGSPPPRYSQARVQGEAAKNTHTPNPLPVPQGDTLLAGFPKLAPCSPSACETHAGSRVPG